MKNGKGKARKQKLLGMVAPRTTRGLSCGQTEVLSQQFTCGVICEGFFFCGKFAEILRKVCGNSAENSRKSEKNVFIASGKGAEILRKVAEISWKIAEICLQ